MTTTEQERERSMFDAKKMLEDQDRLLGVNMERASPQLNSPISPLRERGEKLVRISRFMFESLSQEEISRRGKYYER